MRVAVAGCGAITQAVYVPLLRRRQDVFEVTAVCDLSATLADAVGELLGAANRYTAVEDMLADGGFDAVIILTSGSHGEVVRLALERGYAVLCEKPLASTREEVTALPDGPLMVGYMKQYDPAVQRAERILGDRQIRYVDVEVLHPSGGSQLAFANLLPPADDVPPAVLTQLRQADDKLAGVALGDTPERVRRLYDVCLGSICHDLSLLRRFTGSPTAVDHVGTWDKEPGSIEVSGGLAGGGRFGIRWHYIEDYPAYRETVTIHHETGSLELVFPAPYLLNAPTRLTAVSGDGGEAREEFRSVTEAFEEQLLAFHAMVAEGTPPRTDAGGALEDIVSGQRIAARYAVLNNLPIGGEAGAG